MTEPPVTGSVTDMALAYRDRRPEPPLTEVEAFSALKSVLASAVEALKVVARVSHD